MNHLALVGPPHLTTPRIPAAPGIYRIGRGESPVAAVSFDPSDDRRRRNLLTWFERGGEPGATLLIDDWKLCAQSDPGLTDAVRWITTTARDVRVIVTARTLGDLPEQVHLRVEVLDFLALHGIHEFSKALAWKGRWWKVPVGIDGNGEPVVAELTHFADGKWRTGSHLAVTDREAFRSLLLGLMTTHSPKLFQAIFIDAGDSGVFADLDQAPHVQAHHRDAARDPARLAEMLLAESERRLEVVGNAWTIFDHRALGQVLPQLLICVSGFSDIEPTELGKALATIAEDVGRSGMQLLLDCANETTRVRIDDCVTPANLGRLAAELPRLMHRAEPPPDFFTLHDMPKFDRTHAWRPRPIKLRYRTAVGVDEHGQPVEIDIKAGLTEDGMGPHGEVVAPPERRADALKALILGQMLWHSPEQLQVVLVDFHGTGVFAGLEHAPHVQPHDLVEDLERRIGMLVDGTAPPRLLVCVDGVHGLAEARPAFFRTLQTLAQVGRTYGQHLLLSDTTPPSDLPQLHTSYRLELTGTGWQRRISRSVESFVLPTDLHSAARSLPVAMYAATS
ncbi:hypothetical protein [Lentzea flava]|uniref:FtsK/SpoIIIE family protein n=1 Tax=Lentzea flava TaxID=103732 RepID=A0ABQ2V4W0_9PSEU|nr:hypothetical protein [Lentzea flava]MCP2203538.1 hypothetical protein [Lentzea flava]GGU69119.1 hypothetical protein GCM10010178_71120 [Lentzea flava]